MSNSFSQTEISEMTDLLTEFGSARETIDFDHDSESIAVLTGRIRGQLLEAISTDKVSLGELARRLRVSKSAVSRHLRGDGDLRISTAVLLAKALGRHWAITLRKDVPERRTNWPGPTDILGRPTVAGGGEGKLNRAGDLRAWG